MQEDLSIFFNLDEFAESIILIHAGVETEIKAIINYAVDVGKFSGVKGSGATGTATIAKPVAVLFYGDTLVINGENWTVTRQLQADKAVSTYEIRCDVRGDIRK